jgi:hypothetical protein
VHGQAGDAAPIAGITHSQWMSRRSHGPANEPSVMQADLQSERRAGHAVLGGSRRRCRVVRACRVVPRLYVGARRSRVS